MSSTVPAANRDDQDHEGLTLSDSQQFRLRRKKVEPVSLEDSGVGFDLEDDPPTAPKRQDDSSVLLFDEETDHDEEVATQQPRRSSIFETSNETERPSSRPAWVAPRPQRRDPPERPDDDDDDVRLDPNYRDPEPVRAPRFRRPETLEEMYLGEEPTAPNSVLGRIRLWHLILAALIIVIVFVLWLINRSFGSATPSAPTAAAAPAATNAATAANTAAPAAQTLPSTNQMLEIQKDTKFRIQLAGKNESLQDDAATIRELTKTLAKTEANVIKLAADLAEARGKLAEEVAKNKALSSEIAKLRKEAKASSASLAVATKDLADEKVKHATSVTNLRQEIADAKVLLEACKAAKECCEKKASEPVQVKVENFITVPAKDTTPTPAPAPAPKPICAPVPKCCN